LQDTLTVAAASVDSKPGETSANLDKLAHYAAQAAQSGAQLVLFPELSLTGFLPNHPERNHEVWLREALAAARSLAEPLSGPAVTALSAIARSTGLYLSAGLLEDAGNLLFNTQVLVGPGGLAAMWRKMHIPMFELPFYCGGPAPSVAATPLGRIGANICFDAMIPESTRLLAVQQVEIVLFPFAADPPPGTAAAWSAWAAPAIRARCIENGVFGVACNYAGHVSCAGAEQHFPGGALIAGPRGEVLAENIGSSPMLIHELRGSTLRSAQSEPEYLFRFRRPELYGSLAK
jgi:N-carbamoylputrescine amidase